MMVQGDEGLLFLITACRKQISTIPVGIKYSLETSNYLSTYKPFYTHKNIQKEIHRNMSSIHAYVIS